MKIQSKIRLSMERSRPALSWFNIIALSISSRKFLFSLLNYDIRPELLRMRRDYFIFSHEVVSNRIKL